MTSEQSETPALTNENRPVQAAKSKNEAIEFEPPVACVRRLLKNALPKSTNVSKDSAAALTRACGIFVLYLASCANDLAREGRRTTVSAKDVLGALHELDFDEFIPQMEKFLEQHRKEEQAKKEEKERLKASKPEVEKKSEGVSGQRKGVLSLRLLESIIPEMTKMELNHHQRNKRLMSEITIIHLLE
jgi:DNA polymerase epsilon subunit 3